MTESDRIDDRTDSPSMRLEYAVLGIPTNGTREGGLLNRVTDLESRIDRIVIAILSANLIGAVIGGVIARAI